MATLTFKGKPVHTSGELPKVNTGAPNFTLVKKDLSEVSLDNYSGKKKILNIFVSLDTSVCAASVHKFKEKAGGRGDTVVLDISKDLPFAQARFCSSEGLEGVEALSGFRSTFGKDYGLEITDGPLKGLYSRAIVVLDENNKVLYTEQVQEITHEPDYNKALEALEAAKVR
jgi:thioredoxin-dependent peroxiredoxin